MINFFQKFSKTRFKKTNFKAFSFFLGFSLVIWFLVQFSEIHEETLHIPIQIQHVPKDKVIEDAPQFLTLVYEGNGFRIAWYSLFKKTLSIDLSNLPSENGTLVYVIADHAESVFKQLDLNSQKVVFNDKKLLFSYQQKAVKKIPVVSKIKVKYKPGYDSYKTLQIDPDTIQISGPESSLQKITEIQTLPLVLSEVDEDVSGKIKLNLENQKNVTLYQEKVAYKLYVEKFTEGKVEVPVQVINAPKNTAFTLFPSTIQVIFRVSLKNFEKINQHEFSVVCDYKELSQNQTFFIPKIEETPDFVSSIRLGVNKVKFVIKE